MRLRIFLTFAINIIILAWYCSAKDIQNKEPEPSANVNFVAMIKHYKGTLFDGIRRVDDIYEPYEEKRRVPPLGFIGMRGKKDLDARIVIKKRIPSFRFFGLRGKKLTRTGDFFGTRGKKYPYEFRGKFVGVRGKKGYFNNAIYGTNYNDYTHNNYRQLNNFKEDLYWNRLMLSLTASGGSSDLFNNILRNELQPQIN